MTRSQKTYQLHRDLIEVGAYHISMRIEPIGAFTPVYPVYPVRRKRKVEKIPGKSTDRFYSHADMISPYLYQITM